MVFGDVIPLIHHMILKVPEHNVPVLLLSGNKNPYRARILPKFLQLLIRLEEHVIYGVYSPGILFLFVVNHPLSKVFHDFGIELIIAGSSTES